MTTKPKVIKHLVALHLANLKPQQALVDSRHYVVQMTGNSHFPNPTPSLASITTQTDILDKAYAFSLTRAKGSVAKSNTELKTLKALGSYVETEANVDPDNSASIILSSGMFVKKSSPRPPKVFQVIALKQPGSIRLDNKAEKNAVYIYERTTDLNNPSAWIRIGSFRNVKYTDSGLISGTRYYYRCAIMVNGKQGPYTVIKDAVAL
jgi:hypothetical protein